MTSKKAKANRQSLAKTGFATHLNGRKNLPIFISVRKFAPARTEANFRSVVAEISVEV
jgi:hypothetical protein